MELMMAVYCVIGVIVGFVFAEGSKKDLDEIPKDNRSAAYAIMAICGFMAWPAISIVLVCERNRERNKK